MIEMSPADPRIAAIAATRAKAAEALVQTIGEQRDRLTERNLCGRWAQLIAEDPRILSEGWYQPPPNGVSALIGTAPDFARMSYVSLRDAETWPRDDLALTDDALMYAYASPVAAETFMIGDFGVTVYTGQDPVIWSHLATCLEITAKVAAYVEVGMELRDLYRHASDLMNDAALSNETYSTTDATGGVDVGHTLPWSYEEPTTDQLEALRSGEFPRLASAISKARRFHNEEDRQKIQPTMGITVEPRMAGPGRPLASFHVLVTFDQGVKRIHANFAQLFALFDMGSRLPQEALKTLGCT